MTTLTVEALAVILTRTAHATRARAEELSRIDNDCGRQACRDFRRAAFILQDAAKACIDLSDERAGEP